MTVQSFSEAASLRQSIKSLLRSDERVLIVTTPENVPFMVGGVVPIVFNLIFIAFASMFFWVFWFPEGAPFEFDMSKTGSIPKWIIAFMLGSGIYGLAKTVWTNLSGAWALKRTIYAITDKRAIAAQRRGDDFQVSIIDVNRIPKIEYTERSDGSGDIHFGVKSIETRRGSYELPELSFSHIPNVQAAYETALKAKQAAEQARAGALDPRGWPFTEDQFARDGHAT